MNDDIMGITEACDYLHMSRGALAQLRYTSKGPKYIKPTPKTVLYKREWIDDWLNASVRTGTAAVAA